ncbi:MAG: hypothetical protein IPF66_23485 [Holophagales bacterium]|nr:hypothetical protein [Holophagales bacterium]
MGGRIVSIAVDPEDGATFYLGHATGGLWKTTNAGTTFSPLMKDERVFSVGAVAVAPSDPRVIWVGSGEATDRNSAGFGDGVFRSTDAGATWKSAGLKSSRAIGRLRVHPSTPDVAFVAASGDLWTKGGERGLPDDGRREELDEGSRRRLPRRRRHRLRRRRPLPADPNVVIAALYARRRTRDAGGIFRSTDGGATWKKLTNGLPAETGRIGLAVSAANPKVVQAVVQSDAGGTSGIDEIESRAGGIFRSEDGGETWVRTSRLNPRPFCFSQIRLDPVNDQRVYVLGFALSVSDDGGRPWREDLFGKVHPDCHELVVTGTPAPRRPAPPKEGEPPEPERNPCRRAFSSERTAAPT